MARNVHESVSDDPKQQPPAILTKYFPSKTIWPQFSPGGRSCQFALLVFPSSGEPRSISVMLQRIMGQVKQNTVLLQSISKRLQGQEDAVVSVDDFHLPLVSEESFNRAENLLADRAKFKSLVS